MSYLVALAFMPTSDVIEKYEEIISTQFFVTNKSLLEPFLTYFERTWIGIKRRGRRGDPIFPLNLWNVRDAVLLNQGKTNNGCEGFNTFATILSSQHPTIWKFILGLKQQQSLTEVRMTALAKCYRFTN